MNRTRVSHPARWLAASGLALILAASPVTLDPSSGAPTIKSADARGGGGNGGGNGGGGNGGGNGGGGNGGGGKDGGNGHGGGKGGDRDHAGRGQGKGKGLGGGHDGGRGMRSYDSLDDFVGEMRGGKGKSEFADARGRYDEAVSKGRGRSGEPGFGQAKKAAELSPEEAQALIERGWKSRRAAELEGFRNHGHRVSTMVELAKQLGYGARVGAMQGNFGTPFENGIADLQSDLAAAEAELAADPENPDLQARVAELEAEIAAAVESAKPGLGPDGSWATADLDVNDDGVVDPRDLEALDTADQDGETSADASTTDGTAG